MAYKDFRRLFGIRGTKTPPPTDHKVPNLTKHRRDKAKLKQHLKAVKESNSEK